MKTSISNNSKLLLSLIRLTLCFSLFFSINPDFAQSETQIDNGVPIHVVSDKMVAQKGTSMVEFIGNVKVTRLNSIMLADSIKIFFTENNDTQNGTPQSRVKKIISTGNVRYTEEDRKAFADKAVYTTKEEILVLTGKAPKLITGSSFVTGKKITLFRKQDKVIVESDGTQRVEALFNPEDKPISKQ